MIRVLLVKMSSLGDVIHALPGVTDAVTALGRDGVSFDWVVEEAFQDLPARHPAVDRVIPVAWRRWRRALAGNTGEMWRFLTRLRRRRYDVVLDAQGLVKSAAVTLLARGGTTVGLSRRSAREGAASLFYRRQVAVPRERHAVDRIRRLFAAALGYPCPTEAPDYGISGTRLDRGDGRSLRCLLLHGTTWESKHWPVTFWQTVARRARAEGFQVLVPWGDEREQRRATQIAGAAGAQVLGQLPLGALADELAAADLVIGVDSGLAHLAAALAVPTVVVYGSSSSALTGVRGARVRNLQAGFPCSPCLSRVCTYQGPGRSWQGETVTPACYAELGPDTVWPAARLLVAAQRIETEQRNADRLLHL